MSYDQEYSIPSVQDLLEQLAKKSAVNLLEQHLKDTQGLSIVSMEEVEIVEGFIQDVIAHKVTLSDGRVFIPKLVQTFTENGNHGVDVYEYCSEDETPEVRYVGIDTSETPDFTTTTEVVYNSDGLPVDEDAFDQDLICGDDGCGCGF